MSPATLNTPAIHSRNSELSLPDLTSAMMIRCGVPDPTKYGLRESNADRGHQFSRNPLLTILREAAKLDGINVNSECELLFQLYQQERSFSTSAVSQLFTTVFGALFQAGFDAEFDSTIAWTNESDSLNLKSTPIVRPSAAKPLERRVSGGSAYNAEFEITGESTQVKEYAVRFQLDEQDILDDSFRKLGEIAPKQMGVAAGRLRMDLVYSVLLANLAMRDNVALFDSAGHANVITGSALATATLESAAALISKQTEGGVALNLRGRYLIVPQALERTAQKLVREVELSDPESTPPPTVISDSRLDLGITDPDTGTSYSGSATTWFMSTRGNHTIEVSFLLGTNRLPVLDSGPLNQGKWGQWFSVRHFIGAKALDWRGLTRATA